MKRIKLFEAFNNGDKIEKLNHLLLCWCVKQFIKDEELESKIIFNRFFLYKYVIYFKYDFEYDEFNICDIIHLKYFIKKFIPSSLVGYNQTAIQKAAKQVIKKMYEHEKNKTI
jgi:hypothetical protein